MPVSSVTEHWIRPDALTINLNHFGDPDYLQVSLLAGAVVMAFKQDVIGYNAAHNYRTWPLQAANTYLETSSAYHVYAKLSRSEVNASALIAYDPILRDINGCEITYDNNGYEQLGEPNPDLFYIYMGKISSSLDSSGNKIKREWIDNFKPGSLDTSQQKNEMYDLSRLFVGHYDDPLNPGKLTWIEAKGHLGIKGGITTYASDDLEIPIIAEELPYDKKTIWLNPETGKIEVIGGTGGGGGTLTKEEIIGMGFNLGSEDIGDVIEDVEEEYATKGYVNEAISNIGGGGGIDKIEPLVIKDSTGVEKVVFDGSEEKTVILTKHLVGLSNVNNTEDSEKSVKYAESAGYASNLKSGSESYVGTITVGSEQQHYFGRAGIFTRIQGNGVEFWLGEHRSVQELKMLLKNEGELQVEKGIAVGRKVNRDTPLRATLDVEGDAWVNDALTIGGIRLSKLEDGVLKLDGHLVVTGGLTTYANDETSVSNELLQSLVERISALESEVERLKNG